MIKPFNHPNITRNENNIWHHLAECVDAGHIHLGEKATFQPDEMRILDYRIEQ